MPERSPPKRALVAGVAIVLLGGCGLIGPSPTAIPTASPSLSPSPSPSRSASATASSSPTATPEPELSLQLPEASDPRQVRVAVTPALEGDGGQVSVVVTNLSDTRIGEIVLRWPTELADTVFLAPFVPSPERVAEFGDPLTLSTDWTKWVEGPGELGEPAGTTSLGYGPMDPGMVLTIPLYATRRADGPVGFDLHVLDGEDLLSLEGGVPGELRVELP
jgi:hypothetical protein